jgi:formylglycine-generating enzyme required for sulfatase activity
MTNCGAGIESCCTSIEVQGGTYHRTYDFPPGALTTVLAADGGPTAEADPATVSTFRLDKYLVTVGRYRQFVDAVSARGADGGTGWLPGAGSGKHAHLNAGQGLVNSDPDSGVVYEMGWLASDDAQIAPTDSNLACDPNYATWTSAKGSHENLPINCVNWQEAFAFCIWDGGFLPSEAEWEYAAAGGSEEREYPWGSTPPGTENRYAIYGCYYPSGSGSCSGVSNIAAVGTAALGAARWGHLDLAGELWEWNLDWEGWYADPCTDCAYLTPAIGRIERGGGFSGSQAGLPPPLRSNDLSERFYGAGLRCARTP